MKAKIEFLSVPDKISLVTLIKERFRLGLKKSKDIVDIGTLYFDGEDLNCVNSLPETNIRDLGIFASKLDDLNIEYNLEIIKSDKEMPMPFKEVKELQDIGKYIVVPIDVIFKLQGRNNKKDEEIKKLKDSISSLEKIVRDLESKKNDYYAIKQNLETILKKY